MFIENKNNLIEKLISINRVSKTVKGGRIFSFTALTVVGNLNGKIGIGYSKSKEIPIAVQKSFNNAKKNIFIIYLNNNKLYYPVKGKYLKSIIYIKPSYKERGIIASNTVKSILTTVGINNVFTKLYGSSNPINVVKATIDALKKIKNPKYFLIKRNLI